MMKSSHLCPRQVLRHYKDIENNDLISIYSWVIFLNCLLSYATSTKNNLLIVVPRLTKDKFFHHQCICLYESSFYWRLLYLCSNSFPVRSYPECATLKSFSISLPFNENITKPFSKSKRSPRTSPEILSTTCCSTGHHRVLVIAEMFIPLSDN